MILNRLNGIIKLQSTIFSTSLQWIEKNIPKTSALTRWNTSSSLPSCSLPNNTQSQKTTVHQILQSKEFHSSAVCCKYHDLTKRRMKFAKKMNMLQARLDRLDKEDRPTGCILCPMKGDIEIDHKNVRLLSQFISPHTGRIYGRALTGLCDKKQKEITKAIKRSQALGFMPVTMKYFEFHNDPRIF